MPWRMVRETTMLAVGWLALAARVYYSDAAVKACVKAINAVRITAYNNDNLFANLFNNAIALPICDNGNVGIRRRHMQELMLSETHDPWTSTYGSSVSNVD